MPPQGDLPKPRKPEMEMTSTPNGCCSSKESCSTKKGCYSNSAFVSDSLVDGTSTITSNRRGGEKKDSEESFEFDDLLPHVGEFGLYQKVLFLLMIPFAFFVAWVYFTQIFITITPEEYWCWVPELENLTKEERLVYLG